MKRHEIYRALADGKAIEGRTYVGKWEPLNEREVLEWVSGDLDNNHFNDDDFRLAPAPDCCECGHGWTKHRDRGCTHWIDEDHRYCECKITSPAPKPATKMVPLGPEDVKPGSVIRLIEPRSESNGWLSVISVGILGISRASTGKYPPGFESWACLRRFEISRDGCNTWQRCEKPEVQS